MIRQAYAAGLKFRAPLPSLAVMTNQERHHATD